VIDVTVDPLRRADFLHSAIMSAGERAMQYEQPRPQYRHSARGAVRARQDNQAVEIAIISLAGLALTLFEMAHYAGSAVLQQMFAL
jgi:hypothetical protein